jgi:hypothetical protein
VTRIVYAGLLSLLVAVVPAIAIAQQPPPWRAANNIAAVPRDELDDITRRGRILAAYDLVSWHATDAIMALQPRTGLIEGYLARQKPDALWEVVFGKLTARSDSFAIAFRAVQKVANATTFTTYEMRPPSTEGEYFARAARALYLCRADLGPVSRPYNAMVIPVIGETGWYVYFVPAPTVTGVWPHGGDQRYRVSADGRSILERRRMHIDVLDVVVPRRDSASLVALTHTAVLDDRPEDTDVFLVLTRQPRVEEIVVSRSYYFVIDTTGRIMAYKRDTTRQQ